MTFLLFLYFRLFCCYLMALADDQAFQVGVAVLRDPPPPSLVPFRQRPFTFSGDVALDFGALRRLHPETGGGSFFFFFF